MALTQMKLEEIKESKKEGRWENEDDASSGCTSSNSESQKPLQVCVDYYSDVTGSNVIAGGGDLGPQQTSE